MKKLLLATSFISFMASSAMADEMNNRKYDQGSLSRLSGVYVGAFGGYGWTDGDGPTGISPDLTGGDYGVFVGYKADTLLDETINRVGLGLNGAIEFHYAESNQDDNEGGVSYEKDYEWGVSFRPGLSILSDNLPLSVNPYGILGYKRAEYEASAGVLAGDETYDGFELGIGTEALTFGDFGVRVEYAHTFYGEEDGFDPSENTVRAGVAYHF